MTLSSPLNEKSWGCARVFCLIILYMTTVSVLAMKGIVWLKIRGKVFLAVVSGELLSSHVSPNATPPPFRPYSVERNPCSEMPPSSQTNVFPLSKMA